MITALLILCLIAVLVGNLAYRIERDQRTERINELEHLLDDALVRAYNLEHEARRWHLVAAECRQVRFRLLSDLAESKKRLVEKNR